MQNNLRSLRKQKGLTLKDLSKKTGLSIGLIGNFETGERGISRDALEKIASELSASVAEILPGVIDARVTHAGDHNDCPGCADKDREIAGLREELKDARAVIRDQASALAAALAIKPSPAAGRAYAAADGVRKEGRSA